MDVDQAWSENTRRKPKRYQAWTQGNIGRECVAVGDTKAELIAALGKKKRSPTLMVVDVTDLDAAPVFRGQASGGALYGKGVWADAPPVDEQAKKAKAEIEAARAKSKASGRVEQKPAAKGKRK